jgi:hypothetical protein
MKGGWIELAEYRVRRCTLYTYIMSRDLWRVAIDGV